MTSTYDILFSVEVLHGFYSNNVCTDFTFRPSVQTAALLQQLGLMYRIAGNRLVILAKTQAAGSGPVLIKEIPSDARFVFYMDLMRPEFTSLTNIELERLNHNRYYFTNRHKNLVGAEHYISAPLNNYRASENYKPGNIVMTGGNVFECIKASTGNNTSSTEFWQKRADKQYVSANDLLVPVASFLNYFDDAHTNFDIRVYGFNETSRAFDREIYSHQLTFKQPPQQFKIPLPPLPKTKYKVSVNGDEWFIYLDEEFVWQNYFGVVEIFSNTGAFGFLGAGSTLLPKEYKLRFANRLTYLKYHSQRKGVAEVTDALSRCSFIPFPSAADAGYFESDKPVPLTRRDGNFRFTLKSGGGGGGFSGSAPDPDVRLPGGLMRTSPDGKYYCNVFLNC